MPAGTHDMLFDSDGLLYAAHASSGITLIDGLKYQHSIDTQSFQGSILAFSEKTKQLFVAEKASNEISIISAGQLQQTLMISPTETGFILDIAINPTNGWLYVITNGRRAEDGSNYPSRITIFDAELNLLDYIEEEHTGFTDIVIDPINNYIYISKIYITPESNVLESVYILQGLQKTNEFPLEGLDLLVLNPQNGDLFALGCDIEEYDLTLFRQGELITQLDNISEICNGLTMQIHPISGDLYIIYPFSHLIVVGTNNDNLIIKETIFVGDGGAKMAIDPQNGNVYVANFADNTVSVIQGLQNVATIDVGWYPYGINVHPTNGYVYVSNTNDKTITVLGYQH
ncbi:MAG TPA: hypothetical protein VLL52_13565 [Anaerolineae bacterium]|nr:hypothetical protein [Anaerolineae bacterium]